MLWYQQEENTRKPIEIHYNINKIKNEKTWESKACEGRKMGHHLRPNVNCLIMPPKDAEESFLKRPIGSVIIQYELVVLHVIRQLPKRHQSASLAFAWGLQILLLGVVVDCERTRVRVVVVVVVGVGMVGFTIHFPSFSLLPNRPLSEAHCLFLGQCLGLQLFDLQFQLVLTSITSSCCNVISHFHVW